MVSFGFLQELQLGFKGELTMSENMEDMATCLYSEKLPHWRLRFSFWTFIAPFLSGG